MKRKDILLLLISSVILVTAWIVFSIMHQLVTPTINQTVSQSISPIEPSFDISIINTLKTRTKVAPLLAVSITPSPSPISQSPITGNSISPTPTISFTQSGSSSALPTISLLAPSSSQGGTTQ